MMAAGPTDRWALAGIAELLAKDFTVFNYDRRSRGDSGDTAGGAILALQAAVWGADIGRLALWEAPFILPGSRTPVRADYRQNLERLLAEGRRGDMFDSFMIDAVGMPAQVCSHDIRMV